MNPAESIMPKVGTHEHAVFAGMGEIRRRMAIHEANVKTIETNIALPKNVGRIDALKEDLRQEYIEIDSLKQAMKEHGTEFRRSTTLHEGGTSMTQ